MKTIDPTFIGQGASRMNGGNVRTVLENADAIGERFSRGGPLGRLLEDAKLLLSLVRDYWLREYRAVPYWVIGAAVFALLYVLAPIDLMPDAIPLVGFVDDAAVISVCLALVRQELTKYAAWKRQRLGPGAG